MTLLLWCAAAAVATLGGCGGSDGSPLTSAALSCDDSIKTGYKPDADTTVLVVTQQSEI